MGDFKRNSSRFSRGGAQDGGQSRGGFQRGGQTGGNGGGYQRREGGSSNADKGGGQQKDFPFTRIASLSMPKSASDDARAYAESELKNSELTMTAKVYLGKGDNELTLKNGDQLLIQFKTTQKDPEFVLGHISVKN